MIRKLRQKKGETLVETLFSMLIAVLATMLLCTAFAAAMRINAEVKALDEKYQEDLLEVEGGSSSTTPGKINITFKTEDKISVIDTVTGINVDLYGSSENKFLSYEYNIPEEVAP